MLPGVKLFHLLVAASCIAVLAVGATTPGVAHAESRTLKKARRAFDNYEFDSLVPLLRRALKQTKNAKEQADIYRMLGIVYVAQSQKAQAKKAFVMALERQPNLDLGPSVSAQVRDTFAVALKEFKARRPALAKATPTSPAAAAVSPAPQPPSEPPAANTPPSTPVVAARDLSPPPVDTAA